MPSPLLLPSGGTSPSVPTSQAFSTSHRHASRLDSNHLDDVDCAVPSPSFWFYLPAARRDSQARARNQDEVYEAVVRDVFASGHPKPTQLVFDENLQSGDAPWSGSGTACMESVRQEVSKHRYTPMFNTLADKVYRLVAHGAGDYSIRADTVEDFVKQSCIGGHLSQTFHTDLPRVYISPASVHFERIWSADGKEDRNVFSRIYRGSDGIISFSRVGFDSNLNEAMVSSSFVCGGLCGDGRVYVLRKRSGRWSIVNAWLAWIS